MCVCVCVTEETVQALRSLCVQCSGEADEKEVRVENAWLSYSTTPRIQIVEPLGMGDMGLGRGFRWGPGTKAPGHPALTLVPERKQVQNLSLPMLRSLLRRGEKVTSKVPR